MGVGLKYSDNNILWLTVYTRSFVSFPILGAFKGLCLSSLDNCSENYNRFGVEASTPLTPGMYRGAPQGGGGGGGGMQGAAAPSPQLGQCPPT